MRVKTDRTPSQIGEVEAHTQLYRSDKQNYYSKLAAPIVGQKRAKFKENLLKEKLSHDMIACSFFPSTKFTGVESAYEIIAKFTGFGICYPLLLENHKSYAKHFLLKNP